ncbi:hypothetical protein [Pseudomonas kribbensis]|uniref:Uncharacterized protein n=1 Tax=Pseudomonas kribbensis TaxID=1628086 RepID=A0A4Y8V686_9PSED|nr:hypothetical protein [Pseudomonas kribbensis]TFH76566.1 hypothetical protein E4J90_26255 [Pseudomonas kribbensis]
MKIKGVFIGTFTIAGYAPTCSIGFQYMKETTESLFTGSGNSYANIPTAELTKEQYLCANTCNGSSSARFEIVQLDDDSYYIRSVEPDFYAGNILSLSNGYLYAYPPGHKSLDSFKFNVGGQSIDLCSTNTNIINDIEITCIDGGLELHKKNALSTNTREWAAYLVSRDGSDGLIGHKFTLSVIGQGQIYPGMESSFNL